MNWLAILSTVFSYCWLLAILWLLWRLYRTGLARNQHVISMEKTLTETMQANASAALMAAESARIAVETVHNVVALLAKEQEHE